MYCREKKQARRFLLFFRKPVIKGTRLTVEFILNILAHGGTIPELLNEYTGLSFEDVQACILFASKSMEDSSYMPLSEAIA